MKYRVILPMLKRRNIADFWRTYATSFGIAPVFLRKQIHDLKIFKYITRFSRDD